MELPQTSIQSSSSALGGFTLLEILIVVSILLVLVGLSFGIHIEFLERYSFQDERDKVVLLLMRARNDALAEICYGATCDRALSHGLHIENHKLVLFQGDRYDPNDSYNEVHALSNLVSISGASEILFKSGSADASTTSAGSVLLLQDESGSISTTTITSEGGISWTH